MKKDDIVDNILQYSGCGCAIIVVVAIAFAIISGMRNGKQTEPLKHLRDSVEKVQKLDSIKQIEYAMDMATDVICFDGDSLYHYYINCNYIYTKHGMRIISREKAKELGFKSCPDCMQIESNYMIEKGDPLDSEQHIETMKTIYSN